MVPPLDPCFPTAAERLEGGAAGLAQAAQQRGAEAAQAAQEKAAGLAGAAREVLQVGTDVCRQGVLMFCWRGASPAQVLPASLHILACLCTPRVSFHSRWMG